MYRISLLDLVPDGQTWDETVTLAKALEAAGASVINTGIGWHEARVPTIITRCRGRRSLGSQRSRRLRPRSASRCRVQPDQHPRGRRGDPRRGPGRPGLDGPAVPGRPGLRGQGRRRPRRRDQHLHRLQPGLPGPRVRQQARLLPGQPAGRPGDRPGARPDPARKRVAVVGAGPAGLAAAVSPAERGHEVTCSRPPPRSAASSGSRCGSPARRSSPRRCATTRARLEVLGVDYAFDAGPADDLAALGFDEVVVATGVTPRPAPRARPPEGGPYADVLRRGHRRRAGRGHGRGRHRRRRQPSSSAPAGPTTSTSGRAWGVGDPALHRGGLIKTKPRARRARGDAAPAQDQRSARAWARRRAGRTGRCWTQGRRRAARRHLRPGRRRRLHVSRRGEHGASPSSRSTRRGVRRPGAVRELDDAGRGGVPAHLIGGADVAAELDAKRAIQQGTRVAAAL